MILVGNEYELNRVLQASAPNVGIIHIGIVLGWFIIFLSLSWDSVKQVSEEAWR